MLSCSSEADELNVVSSEPEEMTEEMLEKIAYGCDSYLYENPTDEKVETSASDEYMALIEQRLSEYGGNKYVEYDFDGKSQCVGVLKINTCGKYDEVELHYDCEDTKNTTDHYGFIGNECSTPGNIVLKFCLVPYGAFGHTGEWYGVMNFTNIRDTANLDSGKGILECYMDAEDHNPQSYIRVNTKWGTFPAHQYDWQDNYKVGQVEVHSNGNLKFQMIVFESGNNQVKSAYPDFGFDYGLFGTLYPNIRYDYKKTDTYGVIYSDDEDRNNANSVMYNGSSVKNTLFNNIIKVTANTELHISTVKTRK